MSHKSKAEQRMTLRKRFVERRCPMPFHWCNGEVIPPDGRLEIDGHTKELRRRAPCEYYDVEKGCRYIKHPKYSVEWKYLNRRTEE